VTVIKIGAATSITPRHEKFGLIFQRFNAVLISKLFVNFIYGFQPFVRFGIVIDIGDILLAKLNKELRKDDPLEGFIRLFKYG
jgi:hypothetical protein